MTPLLRTLARAAAALVLVASSAAAQPNGRAASAQAMQPPTLIVFITVDQMRPDYLTRFGSQLTGGLARLAQRGAFFTNAFQDHAITETAPGHASTMSGRFPRSTGIVMNSAGVQDASAPLIQASGPGASPMRFRGTVLADWLRSKDPRTRVLSVSRKDRGAIFPVGRSKQNHVFWYSTDGKFTTSTYYASALPSWVTRFNATVPRSYAGKVWTPLLDASAYPEPDSVAIENGGQNIAFPHPLPTDSAQAARALPAYPMMDEATLSLALEGVRALDLGRGPQTDLLAVSLSTTDAVGHAFGPDSRELHDQILRLDRYLGAFFDSLFKMRDSTRIVVALTADHGVQPYPEVKSRDPNAGAGHVSLAPIVSATRRKLAARGVDSSAFDWGEFLLVDRAALARAKVNADSLVAAFAEEVRKLPGVESAETLASLAKHDTTTDAVARRWLHMIPPDVHAELVVSLKPYWYWGETSTSAEHGSPNDLDARVPIIFYGPYFRPGKYDEFARVVDMAPTLAVVANVTPAEKLDGHVLERALRP